MAGKKDLCFVFRKRNPGFHSVETVFGNIRPHIDPVFRTGSVELSDAGASLGSIWKNLRHRTPGCDARLYHVTGHVNYMVLRFGRKSILTVHDMGSVLSGSLLSRWLKLLFWFRIPLFLAGKVTAVSEFTLAELRQKFPRSIRKCVVIPNAAGPRFTFEPARTPAPPYRILCIGTKPNKNLERTLEAVRDLATELPGKQPLELTIVGPLSPVQTGLLLEYGISYVNLEEISHERLVRCYRETDLLCFVSTYEGFGLPVIEAQATGRPVVTSGRGAMKEVAGTTACLVDPLDPRSIKDGILRVLTDGSYRDRLVEDGRVNAHRFRPEAIAGQYVELYREMLGKGRDPQTGDTA